MSKAYLGIGTNIGDKRANIEKSIELLDKHPQVEVTKVSSYYETEPVGFTEQDWFQNIALEVETALEPLDLLALCNQIEKDLGRERIIRWGPRIIDVDILTYEGFTSGTEKLTVPHPRMHERSFVMVPLYEIIQDLEIHGRHIKEILDTLEGEEVRKMDN